MTNNNLFIHIESGNIFYQNFNTNEMCSFLLAQQDKTKKLYQIEQLTTTVLRHTSKAQDTYGLKEIEKKDKQFLMEKNYTWNRKRKSSCYLYPKNALYNSIEKMPGIICVKYKKPIKFIEGSISRCL